MRAQSYKRLNVEQIYICIFMVKILNKTICKYIHVFDKYHDVINIIYNIYYINNIMSFIILLIYYIYEN